MSPKRLFFVLMGVIALLVGLSVASTYFAHGMLQKEGTTLLDRKLEQAALERQSQALVQAKRDIAEYEGLEAIAKAIVPQEKDQARTVLEIVKLANETDIKLSSIDFPDSLLGEIATKGKSKKTVDNNTTQLTPLDKPKGVYVMEISVQSDTEAPITYSQLLRYLKKLEKNRRTAQIVDISIQPSDDNRNLVSFSLVINSYVRPRK